MEAVELPITGGCGCGNVRFEVGVPFLSAGYCHCTRCQRRTGTAASAQARLAPGSFRLLAGEEFVREYAPEDTVRFYALRLHEVGMLKSTPQNFLIGM